ncbi:MAG: ABC transporter permease subunit [Bacteroidetes bacterium]|nr:ABC transporter permease subunit [Bacteroidota bacterium]MCW5894652.1 ABC transporter permease subunit [Bacteroidota bacterium]
MFITLLLKELRSILLSPKFTTTFAVVSILLLLSVYVGIQEFHSYTRQYHAANELVRQEMREARGWMQLNTRVYREPDPMQIFVSGVHNDVGRVSGITNWQPVKLVNSTYSDDPIFAFFRFIDFTFIVQVVLTLFAILFTYDAVNGERERGTLQLLLSNAVPRASLVIAKFAGTWFGLVLPLAIPVLISLLLLPLLGIPMTSDHWLRLGLLLGASLLLFTFFMAFGVLVSLLTRRSSVSFLFCLVAWVSGVLIIPRAAVMLAGRIVQVPTVAEVEARQDSYAKDQWSVHMKELGEEWRKRNTWLQQFPENERSTKREEMEWEWAEQDDGSRKLVQNAIDENARILKEELRNRKHEQERLAFMLSRFSPVSAFQLAVMNLAETDITLKARYEDALNIYRTAFNRYKQQKQKESGDSGGIRISVDSERGVKIDTGREIALDLSGIPEFTRERASISSVLARSIVDFGLLSLFSLIAFAAAFVMFLRYDVRYSAG